MKKPVLVIRMGTGKPTVVLGKDRKISTRYPAEYLTQYRRNLPREVK